MIDKYTARRHRYILERAKLEHTVDLKRVDWLRENPEVMQAVRAEQLRELNEFYFSFTGSNPHPLICEFENKNDSKAEELHQLHKKLSDILGILNDNVACISGKQLIYARQTKEIYHTYDWT